MTVEEHFERMQKKCDVLSAKGNMLPQLLFDEARKAYAKLDDRQKANIHVDPNTGIMASSGDPEKAIACVVGAAGFTSRELYAK